MKLAKDLLGGVLAKNISKMFSLQVANYLFPLLTLPFLSRVLGPQGFGEMGFAMAVVGYLSILVDYGFNLSATQAIVENRQISELRSLTFWNVAACKGLLFVGACMIFTIALAFSAWSSDKAVLLAAFPTVFGSLLNPVWFLQGMETMGGIAVCSIVARLVTLPLLLLVHGPEDAWLAVAIQTAAAVLGSAISLALVWQQKVIEWRQPTIVGIRKTFVEGWHVFVSTVAISAYTNTNVLVLGVLSGSEAVGQFVATDKVRQAAQNSTSSVTQAVYPHINALMFKDRDAAFRFLIRMFWYFGGLTFLMSLLILTFASPIVQLVLGHQYVASVNVLRLLAFLPFLVALSNIFGIQTMLSLGMQRQFSSIVLWSAIINLCLIIPLSYWYSAEGAAASILITEAIVTAQMGRALVKTEFVSTRIGWRKKPLRSC